MSLNYKQALSLISKADSIVLFHHVNPDFDTYSSLFAFFNWFKENFNTKPIRICLDIKNLKSQYFHSYIINNNVPILEENEDVNEDYLAIVFDVCQYQRIFQNRLLIESKKKIVFDHHRSTGDAFDLKLIDATAVSTSQILTWFFINFEKKHKFSEITAHFLYYGLLTDTGRFMFLNNEPEALKTGYDLIIRGARTSEIHAELYTTTLVHKRFMGYVLQHFMVDSGVAYLIIKSETLFNYKVTRNESSQYVNLLAMIDGIGIHAFITEDVVNKQWSVSLRAKKLAVNEFAKKYGGGGHKLAAGCKLSSLQHVEKMLVELKQFAKTDDK